MAPKKESTAASSGNGKKSSDDSRVVAVSSADGHTGLAVLDTLLTVDKFKSQVDQVVALTYGDSADEEISGLGEVKIVNVERKTSLKDAMENVDTLILIPPSRSDKVKLVKFLLDAAKAAKTVKNVILVSSAGCDFATKESQPILREFIEIEKLVMQPKSDPSTGDTAHSPCIVRPAFYAENLLAYSEQMKESKIPLPIDENHKMAPVALGDVALLLAAIATSKGPNGLADHVRGQFIVVTGPRLVSGPEIAEAASSALEKNVKFESISESQAQDLLDDTPAVDLSDAEKEYLMEYYQLVKSGCTNYVSTAAFEPITGQPAQDMEDFFKAYSSDLKPANKRRRRSAK